MKHITHRSMTSVAWSGGTTTELAIYPEGATYADRTFAWRLSTATIEQDNSTFTSLSGISRVLMMVEGTIVLHHAGRDAVELHPFDVDVFSGDWLTTSEGRGKDVNLMTNIGYIGTLTAHFLRSDDHFEERLRAPYAPEGTRCIGYYAVDGDLSVSDGRVHHELEVGDLLIVRTEELDEPSRVTIHGRGHSPVRLIRMAVESEGLADSQLIPQT